MTILMLLTAGLPRLGVGLAGGQDACGESACHQPVVQMSCCGSDSGDDGFCPMSNGPCGCIAAPAPDPEPKPEAPLPRSDRDTITGMPNGPPKIILVIEPDDSTPSMVSLVIGLRAGTTHNEVQALLGVWQT
jgi:hypothetical protein